jgi:hypothetical protein
LHPSIVEEFGNAEPDNDEPDDEAAQEGDDDEGDDDSGKGSARQAKRVRKAGVRETGGRSFSNMSGPNSAPLTRQCSRGDCSATTGSWRKGEDDATLNALLSKFETNPKNHRFTPSLPPCPRRLEQMPTPVQFMQKPIQLWHPLRMLPGLSLKCRLSRASTNQVCGGPLAFKRWPNQPRFIYARAGGEYLYAAQLQCQSCHRLFSSSDDAILQQLNPIDSELFPYVLTSKGGITKVRSASLLFSIFLFDLPQLRSSRSYRLSYFRLQDQEQDLHLQLTAGVPNSKFRECWNQRLTDNYTRAHDLYLFACTAWGMFELCHEIHCMHNQS